MARKRRRSTLKGYTPLGGSSRRYRTPTGETISRRQYDNIRYGKAGFASTSQYRKVTRSDSYKRWLSMAADTHAIDSVDELTEPDSEFNRLLAKAIDDGFSKDADGSFHDFLVYTGWRLPGDTWDVGDS